MTVFDADAHVEEWDGVFADPYLDPAFRDRRPRVIETQEDGVFPLKWLIDGRLYPRLQGKGQVVFATPASIDGKLTGLAARKPESIESQELRGAEARLAQLKEEGIDLQVIYPTLFLAWPLTDDAQFGQALCRSYNSWLAETCDRSGGKLKWVTVIDPADPIGAAKEIERTKAMGSIGVMVLGMVGDRSIVDPQFDRIWQAAAETDLGVAVHVGFCYPAMDNLYDTTYSEMVVPFAFTMLMAFERVIASGLLDRHPELRVAFLEAGCQWVPFMMERMEERLKVNPGYKGQLKPMEYVRRGNVFFGCEVEEDLLPFCVKEFGADRFLYASDIPHGDRILNSVGVLRQRTDLTEADKDAILRGSTEKFYKLPATVTAG